MEMRKGKKRVQTWIKVTLAVSIPLFLITVAVCWLCVYVVHYNDKVLPNILVAGVDLSWYTHDEAVAAIDPQLYESRGDRAEITLFFPGGAELNITGEAVGLNSNARQMVDEAYSSGRGEGYIEDTLDFLRHLDSVRDIGFLQPFVGDTESFDISYTLDTEHLHAYVSEFTQNYNEELEGSGPQVFADRIIIVKGAGYVRADETEIYDLAYEGLFESLAAGRPIEIAYSLPESKGDTAELLTIRQNLLVDPLSAEYDPETKMISESVVGVDIDLEGAIMLLGVVDSGTAISIDVEYTQPEVTQEFLENLLFRDLIGECVTQIPGTENRLNNIILAAAAVNGLILEPGEEFSFNRTVGQRTTARGYKLAPAFSNGTTVQAVGGGICQVSSTIYSAILDTDIRVTERHPHGLPVAYIPRGRDATVSWGSLDFRFMNNTEYPLRIDAEVDGRTITVHIYGTLTETEPGGGPIGA